MTHQTITADHCATGEPLGQRLLTSYDAMPRSERRLADLLLEDLGAVRHVNAGDLAERAGVSRATAARLFRRLGYSGFKAAQREMRRPRLGSRGIVPPVSDAGAAAVSSPSDYLDAEVKHLVRTFELVRSDEIAEAVQLLRRGEKLWVVGFGDDYPLAHFARALLIRLRSDVRMLPIGGFSIPEEFASISRADTVLALGVGRRTRALRNVMGSAARAGARVILVTHALGGVDRSRATVILRCRADGPTLFNSNTAAVSLITWLCALLAARIGETAAERLQVIEAIHNEWGSQPDPEF